MTDIRVESRIAWERQLQAGNEWTLPVDAAHIEAARRGDWRVKVTSQKWVPKAWLGDITKRRILCLASGGGQQGPTLAAAGAEVTVLDNAPSQLEQDRLVADREQLELTLVEGDMRDLSMFGDGAFDAVIHPIANCYVPDVNIVWREAGRVLSEGGALLSGFMNPVAYCVDIDNLDPPLILKHTVPYADLAVMTSAQRTRMEAEGEPFEFGHTLTDQLAGQMKAGFVLTDMFEDNAHAGDDFHNLSKHFPLYLATRAVKCDPSVPDGACA